MFQKTSIESSSYKFFLFPQQNLDFRHSLDVEMILEEDQNKKLNKYDVQKVWSIDNSRIHTPFEERERIYNISILGMIVGSSPWWDQWLRWNPKRWIIMVNSREPGLHESVKIAPRVCVKREDRVILSIRSWFDASDLIVALQILTIITSQLNG